MEQRAKILWIALLCTVFNAQAMNLGRVHGSATIGQALDVAVDIELDAGEDAAALCLEAEVFQADTRQDATRVRLVIDTAAAGTARVRVHSSSLIEEPVVSFNLRSSCGQKISRLYVMLADLPGEVTQAPVPLLVPAAAPTTAPATAPAATPLAVPTPAPAERPKAATPANAKPQAPPQHRTAPKGLKGRRAAAAAKHSASKPPTPKAAPKPTPATGLPRLKLDPLEQIPDRAPSLAAEVTPQPTPQALLDSQTVLALQGDVKALRESAAKTEANLADLKARLQAAETQRYSGALVLALLGLLLASLLAMALLWSRQRRVKPGDPDWWDKAAPAGPQASAVPVASVPKPGPAALPAAPAVQGRETRISVFSELMRQDAPGADSGAESDRRRALPQPVRQLASPAILKLREQAQQSVTEGKIEPAVQLLKRQIQDGLEPNPFVYLDLLGLLHTLGRKGDFQQLSQDIKLLFNVDLPDFAFFKEQGLNLSSYPETLTHISTLWSRPEALVAIEACIFRDPWADKRQAFDLAAFRDLLLLHSAAQSAKPSASAAAGIDLARLLSERR